jgi:lipopolysaccharide heptosyltransferase II
LADETGDAVPKRALTRLAKCQVRWWLVRFLYRVTDILGKTQHLFRPPPHVLPAQDRIRRILVVRLDLLGDLVMTLPAIEALRARWPEAHIAVLCTPAARDIAARCAAVDAVYTYDPNSVRSIRWWVRQATYAELFDVVRQLRSARFDLACSMFGEFACLFAWASGARHRVGYAQEGYPALLTLAVPGCRYVQPFGHEVQWNEHLVAAVGAPSVAAVPHLQRRGDTTWLTDFLAGSAPHGYVVLAPGAHNGSAKRYLLQSWATVANALVRNHRVRIVLSGTAAELPLVDELTALLTETPLNAAGLTDISRLLALLGDARLLMAGDSGPVHLAAALGTPVVVVFGPTDPMVYRPYTNRATVLRAEIACSPCYDLRSTAECRLGYHVPLCMALVPPGRVLAAAEYWLNADLLVQHRNGHAGTLAQVEDVVLPIGVS